MPNYTLVETGPAFTPLRFGLLSVAEPVSSAERWRMGVARRSPFCGAARTSMLEPCVTGAPDELTPTVTGAPVGAADPFWAYAWAPCAPVGWGNDLAELRARTTAALTNGEGRAVERVFWSGDVADGGTVYPHLAADAEVLGTSMGAAEVVRQPAADVLAAGATLDLVEALGELEQGLAECYGGEGVLHVPRAALAHLDHLGVVRQSGQQLRTLGGNMVAGYSGGAYPGPTGAEPAAGVAWLYATGAVQVYRSDVQDFGVRTAEFIGRTDNTTLYVVGRAYLFDFDCCLLAAAASLGGAVPGAAGGAGGAS